MENIPWANDLSLVPAVHPQSPSDPVPLRVFLPLKSGGYVYIYILYVFKIMYSCDQYNPYRP